MATRAFDHRRTWVNATNGPICSMADTSDGDDAVVAEAEVEAAAGEQMCMMCKRWSPTMKWSSPALVGRVSTGHIVGDMPGSYHGLDSSSCRQLP